MKKFLILIIVLLAIAGAALPWANGLVMEKMAMQTIAEANRTAEESGADLRFELVSYHRGYAQTRAEWKMVPGALWAGHGVKEVVFTESATHGWTGISSQTSLEKNVWYADWIAGPMKGKNPLIVETQYSAFGPIVTKITMTPFTLTSGDRSQKIGALDISITMDKSFSKLSYEGSWEGVSQDASNRLGPLSVQSEMERVSGLIWQGKAKVEVARFAAEDAKGGIVVSNLVFQTDTAADKEAGSMDISVSATADEIKANGESLSAWSLGLGLKKMNMEALEELSRMYAEMAGRMAPLLSDPEMSAERRAALLRPLMVENQMALISQFEKMLKKGFGLKIAPVDMTLPQGRIQGDFSIELLKDMTLAGFFPVMSRPELALDIFSLDSDIRLPAAFSQMQPNLTVPLFAGMKTGLFVIEGENLHHRAQTRDGQLYLNGEVLAL